MDHSRSKWHSAGHCKIRVWAPESKILQAGIHSWRGVILHFISFHYQWKQWLLYYFSGKSTTPANIKFAKKKKSSGLDLSWLKDLSQFLIHKYGFAINAEIYLKGCVQRQLIPAFVLTTDKVNMSSDWFRLTLIMQLLPWNVCMSKKPILLKRMTIPPTHLKFVLLKIFGLFSKRQCTSMVGEQKPNRIKYRLKNIDQTVV